VVSVSIQQDMPAKRVIKTLSIQDKFNLIKDVDSGFKKKDIAVKYGSTVYQRVRFQRF
jgi:hypothetical protein